MALPLPNLDDRRWVDLVDEGRALIPLYAPGWTDHNVHDPGITLLELLAWMAELDLYRINRVPTSHIRKFLTLVGIEQRAPRGARTVLAIQSAVPRIDLPADLEVEARDLAGRWLVFRTLAAVSAVQLELQVIQSGSPSGVQDLTARWRRGETVPLLGEEPALARRVDEVREVEEAVEAEAEDHEAEARREEDGQEGLRREGHSITGDSHDSHIIHDNLLKASELP